MPLEQVATCFQQLLSGPYSKALDRLPSEIDSGLFEARRVKALPFLAVTLPTESY